METSGNSFEGPDPQEGAEQHIDTFEELFAKMQTPEAKAAADSIFTATPEEISKGSASSRFRRIDGTPNQGDSPQD